MFIVKHWQKARHIKILISSSAAAREEDFSN